MIPNTITAKINEATILPSLTYLLDPINKHISGKIDNKDSVLQAIHKILDTEKYAYEIYDWNYGQQLINLIGQDFSFAMAEIPRIISEALLQDDRIKAVSNYNFKKNDNDSLTVTFTVNTIFGDIDYSKEINV